MKRWPNADMALRWTAAGLSSVSSLQAVARTQSGASRPPSEARGDRRLSQRPTAFGSRRLRCRRDASGPPQTSYAAAHHNDMPEQQLNLFSAAGIPVKQALPSVWDAPGAGGTGRRGIHCCVPAANLGDCRAVATEAARRRLGVAIPALERSADVLLVLVLIAWCRQICRSAGTRRDRRS